MSALGVDVGADAVVLIISGLKRLVWARPHYAMMGGNGMPGARRHYATTLQVRRFRRMSTGSEAYLQWDHATDLFGGGRLTLARLRACRNSIDAIFADGVTDQIQIGKTLVLGNDDVGQFLAGFQAKPKCADSKIEAFIEAAEKMTMTSDGCRL